jgi:beta-lactamase class D
MKKIILFLAFNFALLANANCFLAKENNQIIVEEGDCKSRHAPCSTFKIAISLMGYNEGVLIDETHPELQFKKEYEDWLDIWKQSHNPRLWMQNSCVWYSQVLTQEIGMSKFKKYVQDFHYGNQDVSGDKGKDNGLTCSWLSSSLEISAEEQVVFLQKLIDNKLPVNLKSQEMTKRILFIEDLPNGWKLYGKTGMGYQLNSDRTKKVDLQLGWFVGWIQKNNRTIIFVNYIQDKNKQDTYASLRAKTIAKEKLLQVIQK